MKHRDSFQESRVREIRKHGLMRGREVARLPFYSTGTVEDCGK